MASVSKFLHARGQCPLFSCARVRPRTPEPALIRLRTEQLVAGVMDPDLNLPELNP